jgi:ankyrin repeat protein
MTSTTTSLSSPAAHHQHHQKQLPQKSHQHGNGGGNASAGQRAGGGHEVAVHPNWRRTFNVRRSFNYLTKPHAVTAASFKELNAAIRVSFSCLSIGTGKGQPLYLYDWNGREVTAQSDIFACADSLFVGLPHERYNRPVHQHKLYHRFEVAVMKLLDEAQKGLDGFVSVRIDYTWSELHSHTNQWYSVLGLLSWPPHGDGVSAPSNEERIIALLWGTKASHCFLIYFAQQRLLAALHPSDFCPQLPSNRPIADLSIGEVQQFLSAVKQMKAREFWQVVESSTCKHLSMHTLEHARPCVYTAGRYGDAFWQDYFPAVSCPHDSSPGDLDALLIRIAAEPAEKPVRTHYEVRKERRLKRQTERQHRMLQREIRSLTARNAVLQNKDLERELAAVSRRARELERALRKEGVNVRRFAPTPTPQQSSSSSSATTTTTSSAPKNASSSVSSSSAPSTTRATAKRCAHDGTPPRSPYDDSTRQQPPCARSPSRGTSAEGHTSILFTTSATTPTSSSSGTSSGSTSLPACSSTPASGIAASAPSETPTLATWLRPAAQQSSLSLLLNTSNWKSGSRKRGPIYEPLELQYPGDRYGDSEASTSAEVAELFPDLEYSMEQVPASTVRYRRKGKQGVSGFIPRNLMTAVRSPQFYSAAAAAEAASSFDGCSLPQCADPRSAHQQQLAPGEVPPPLQLVPSQQKSRVALTLDDLSSDEEDPYASPPPLLPCGWSSSSPSSSSSSSSSPWSLSSCSSGDEESSSGEERADEERSRESNSSTRSGSGSRGSSSRGAVEEEQDAEATEPAKAGENCGRDAERQRKGKQGAERPTKVERTREASAEVRSRSRRRARRRRHIPFPREPLHVALSPQTSSVDDLLALQELHVRPVYLEKAVPFRCSLDYAAPGSPAVAWRRPSISVRELRYLFPGVHARFLVEDGELLLRPDAEQRFWLRDHGCYLALPSRFRSEYPLEQAEALAQQRLDGLSDFEQWLATTTPGLVKSLTDCKLNLLHYACYLGRPTCLRALTRKDRIHVDAVGGALRVTPLAVAVMQGHFECVKVLVDECNASVDFLMGVQGGMYNSATALLHACRMNRVEIAQYLLDHGSSVSACMADGSSSLTYCTDPTITRQLLDKGADVKKLITHWDSRLWKAGEGVPSMRLLRLYLSYGAGKLVNERPPAAGSVTVLYHLCAGAHTVDTVDGVRLLLEYQADPNLADEANRTPLQVIASAPQQPRPLCTAKIVDMLLSYGADAQLRDKAGLTPLDWCVRLGRWSVLLPFIRHQVLPTAKQMLEIKRRADPASYAKIAHEQKAARTRENERQQEADRNMMALLAELQEEKTEKKGRKKGSNKSSSKNVVKHAPKPASKKQRQKRKQKERARAGAQLAQVQASGQQASAQVQAQAGVVIAQQPLRGQAQKPTEQTQKPIEQTQKPTERKPQRKREPAERTKLAEHPAQQRRSTSSAGPTAPPPTDPSCPATVVSPHTTPEQKLDLFSAASAYTHVIAHAVTDPDQELDHSEEPLVLSTLSTHLQSVACDVLPLTLQRRELANLSLEELKRMVLSQSQQFGEQAQQLQQQNLLLHQENHALRQRLHEQERQLSVLNRENFELVYNSIRLEDDLGRLGISRVPSLLPSAHRHPDHNSSTPLDDLFLPE